MRTRRSWIEVTAEALEGLALLVPTVLAWPLARSCLADLGASAAERGRPWSGDALLDRVDRRVLRGIPIRAPSETVWPWLQQLGRRGAGFYSYELLENVAGFRVHNVERLLPGQPPLVPGAFVELHPSGQGVWVASVTPPHELVFRDWRDEADLEARRPARRGTWSFYLEPDGPGRCRLLLRGCTQVLRPLSRPAHFLQTFVEQPLDLVMEWKLLRTIKRLAERDEAPVRRQRRLVPAGPPS